MNPESQTAPALRLGIRGAALNLAGLLLSGPLGLGLVALIAPTTAWSDPASYASGFHWVQTIPFFGGFALVLGYVIMFAAVYLIADDARRPSALVALVSTGAFATLISLNYISQTTFVPALASAYRPEHGPIIAALSLANPLSLSWAIEMWGYALLGLATWLAAGVFRGPGIERTARMLMTTNGVVSIIGAFITAWSLGWVLTPPGVISYALWNVLVVAMAIAMLLAFRRRLSAVLPGVSALSAGG